MAEPPGDACCMSDRDKLGHHAHTFGTNMLTQGVQSDKCNIRETTGLVLPYRCMVDYSYHHEYQSDIVFFPKDEDRPHLACIMEDTAISPDQILRSEVHGAITLIKHQMRNEHFTDHYIKPVSSSQNKIIQFFPMKLTN